MKIVRTSIDGVDYRTYSILMTTTNQPADIIPIDRAARRSSATIECQCHLCCYVRKHPQLNARGCK